MGEIVQQVHQQNPGLLAASCPDPNAKYNRNPFLDAVVLRLRQIDDRLHERFAARILRFSWAARRRCPHRPIKLRRTKLAASVASRTRCALNTDVVRKGAISFVQHVARGLVWSVSPDQVAPRTLCGLQRISHLTGVRIVACISEVADTCAEVRINLLRDLCGISARHG